MGLPNVSGLFYKIGFAVALLSAGLIAKHDYDGRIAAAAVLKERIAADSAALDIIEATIAEVGKVALVAQARADSLRKLAVRDSTARKQANDSLAVMRARLVITDTAAVNALLDDYARANAHNNAEIQRLWAVIDARDSADVARDAREAAKDEKIAALERLNKNIAKAVAPPTHHLRDGAIGGAIVAGGGAILWATTR